MCFFVVLVNFESIFRSKKVHFRYRFEVPKSFDFGSILGSKKGPFWGPVFSNTLHTCSRKTPTFKTYQNKEREARWNEGAAKHVGKSV